MTAFLLLLCVLVPTSEDALDDLVERLILRLENSASAGITHLNFGTDGQLLTELPDSEDDYSLDLFQQRADGSVSALSHLGKFTQEQLRNMQDGESPESLRNSRIIAVRSGSAPRLAVRFSPTTVQHRQLVNLFGNAIRNQIDRHPIFRIDRSIDIAVQGEFISEGESADIRQQLLSRRVTALLNCILQNRNDQLILICQIVHQSQENDGIVSVKTPVTAELALLMQISQGTTGAGGESVFARVALGSGALAISAINVDSGRGDELAILYPSELHIFKLRGRRFSLLRSVPLNFLERSVQTTKVPTAHMFAADHNGDGKQELLGSFNMLRSGFVVYPSLGFQVEHTLFQPLAVINEDSRTHLYSTDYRPGEDTYLDRTNVIDYFGNTLQRLEIPSMRNLYRMDNRGGRFVVWTDTQSMRIFEPVNGFSTIENFSHTYLKTVFTDPGNIPDTVFFVADQEKLTKQDSFGDDINAIILQQNNAEALVSVPTQLDIEDLTVYNSTGTSPDFIVALGRDSSGSMYFELFRFPESWRRGE